MAIIKKEIDYAKEIGDVFELVEGIVKTIKEKGDYMELLPKLISAVEGVGEIDDEFEASKKAAIQTALVHAGSIVDILIFKKEVA